MDMLQKDGEKMTAQEIKDCLAILSGNPNFELSDIIDGNYLIDTILGFEDMDVTNNDKTAIHEYD